MIEEYRLSIICLGAIWDRCLKVLVVVVVVFFFVLFFEGLICCSKRSDFNSDDN